MASHQSTSNCGNRAEIPQPEPANTDSECVERSKKLQTLGCDINADSAYKHMMDIKTTMLKLDILARSKDAQPNQLRSAIILSMSPIIDRIRDVTEFLEIYNLKKQFNLKRKKYKFGGGV